MADLKPCPFCGGEAKLRDTTCGKNISAYVVRCGNVDCDVRPTTSYFRVRKEAIERWNRRAAEMQPVMTNEDRIHSARGRELAQILYSIDGADFCKELPECWRMLEEPGGIPDDKCIGCLEEWLKKPLEVDE